MLKVIFVNVQAKIRIMMFSIDFQSLIITKISLFMLHWWLVLWVIHRVIVHCILVVNLMLYHYGVLHIKNFFLSVLNWKVNELIKRNVTSKKLVKILIKPSHHLLRMLWGKFEITMHSYFLPFGFGNLVPMELKQASFLIFCRYMTFILINII